MTGKVERFIQKKGGHTYLKKKDLGDTLLLEKDDGSILLVHRNSLDLLGLEAIDGASTPRNKMASEPSM